MAMTNSNQTKQTRAMTVLGWIVTAIPVAAMLLSAAMKLTHHAGFVQSWTRGLGFPITTMTAVGVIELACVVLYLVPRSAVLGAILVAAYLGGAAAAHVRIGQPVEIPVGLGVLAWVGLLLRNPRARRLFSRPDATE